MPCGSRPTSALANRREAPGTDSTDPYFEAIHPSLQEPTGAARLRLAAVSPEVISDLAMLERLVPPADKDVVDVGCGGGALVRALTDLGARVSGVEISESQ